MYFNLKIAGTLGIWWYTSILFFRFELSDKSCQDALIYFGVMYMTAALGGGVLKKILLRLREFAEREGEGVQKSKVFAEVKCSFPLSKQNVNKPETMPMHQITIGVAKW